MPRVYLRTSDVANKADCSEFQVRDAVRRGILRPKKDSKNCALFDASDPETLRRALSERRAGGNRR